MPPPCDVIGIAAGVPTFYQVAQIVSLGFICLVGWKSGWTYAPPGHGFYRVLTRNYQPGAADPESDRIRHEEHEGEGLSGCSCCFPRGGGFWRGQQVVTDETSTIDKTRAVLV